MRIVKGMSKAKKEKIIVKKPDIAKCVILLKGNTPLLCNRRRLDDKIGPKKVKDENREFLACLYPMENDQYGFPASGFKKCFVEASKGRKWFADSQINGKRIMGGLTIMSEIILIEGSPTPREDYVVINRKDTIRRIRAEFKEWKCAVPIMFIANLLNINQIVNVISIAGMAIGIGDWRPQKGGSFGTFEITAVEKG